VIKGEQKIVSVVGRRLDANDNDRERKKKGKRNAKREEKGRRDVQRDGTILQNGLPPA